MLSRLEKTQIKMGASKRLTTTYTRLKRELQIWVSRLMLENSSCVEPLKPTKLQLQILCVLAMNKQEIMMRLLKKCLALVAELPNLEKLFLLSILKKSSTVEFFTLD